MLAELLGMTVGELEQRMTYREKVEWIGYLNLKTEREQRRQQQDAARARGRQVG